MKYQMLIACFLAVAGCEQSSRLMSGVVERIAPTETAVGPAGRFAQLHALGVPRVQIGFASDDRNTIIVLETSRDGIETWLTPSGGAVILEKGMLRGTRGFGGDMLASDIAQSLSLVLSEQTATATRLHTFLNGDGKAVTTSYSCNVDTRGSRDIPLGDGTVTTRLMEEVCSDGNQIFTNLYWIRTTDGNIVQSRQWAGDFTGEIVLRIVP